MPRLRIVTFNIAHGRGLAPLQGMTTRRRIRGVLLKIARLLEELNPDVVALQEIDENSRWAGNFDQLEFLREFGRFPHSVFGINNRRAGLFNLSYGNAILSRHPIVEWENVAFGQRRVGEKGFLFVELDVGRHRVPIVNMHLHYRSRTHRFRQVDQFLGYLAAKQQHRRTHWVVPPIVCGDLNNPHTAGSDATFALLGHLRAYGDYELHPMDKKTYPSPLPSRTLDFIFVPPGCLGVECHVVRSFLSDHRPVVVDLDLP